MLSTVILLSKVHRNLAYVRCSSETHKRLKTEAAQRGIPMQALLDEAVSSLFVSPQSEGQDVPQIPKSLLPVVEFIVDAFSERGAPDEEMWKDTLRMLAAQRSSELKSSRLKAKNPKRNAS